MKDGRGEVIPNFATPLRHTAVMATNRTIEVQVEEDHLKKLVYASSPDKGLIELIWNALDADVDNVTVSFADNGLGGIDSVRIADDGHGILKWSVASSQQAKSSHDSPCGLRCPQSASAPSPRLWETGGAGAS